MNAYAKKLLSWLCVAAMVFAMAPATMLPAFAEETEAAPEIQYGAANLPEGTQEIMDAAADIQAADLAAHIAAGTCPICGEGVEWKEATYPNQTTVEGEKRHYYVKDTTEVQKKYNWYTGNAKNMTLCLALLNTTTPKEIGGIIGLRNQSSGCTLNIMGSGTITSDGKSTRTASLVRSASRVAIIPSTSMAALSSTPATVRAVRRWSLTTVTEPVPLPIPPAASSAQLPSM